MNIRISAILVQYFRPFMSRRRRKYPTLHSQHELWYALIRELERVHYARLEAIGRGKFAWVETSEFIENVHRFTRNAAPRRRQCVFRVHSSRLFAVEALVSGQRWVIADEWARNAYLFGRKLGTSSGTFSWHVPGCTGVTTRIKQR